MLIPCFSSSCWISSFLWYLTTSWTVHFFPHFTDPLRARLWLWFCKPLQWWVWVHFLPLEFQAHPPHLPLAHQIHPYHGNILSIGIINIQGHGECCRVGYILNWRTLHRWPLHYFVDWNSLDHHLKFQPYCFWLNVVLVGWSTHHIGPDLSPIYRLLPIYGNVMACSWSLFGSQIHMQSATSRLTYSKYHPCSTSHSHILLVSSVTGRLLHV